jgi:hypothetical protein
MSELAYCDGTQEPGTQKHRKRGGKREGNTEQIKVIKQQMA